MGANRVRVLLGALIGAVVLAAYLGLRARSSSALPVYWDAPRFALTDQNGDTLRSRELTGRVWIASFIFTHCTDFCPIVTTAMAQLRDSLRVARLLGQRVRLVSFTVDPARDTPEVLRAYAARFGGSLPDEWAFLTGDPALVRGVIEHGFHLSAAPMPPTPGDSVAGYQVLHSPRLVLVDRAGRVRGTYPATELDAIRRLRVDLDRLLREES